MNNTVTSAEERGTNDLMDQAELGKLLMKGGEADFEVEWDPEAIWAVIFSAAFVKWLRGKVLTPVVHDDQVLLRLSS